MNTTIIVNAPPAPNPNSLRSWLLLQCLSVKNIIRRVFISVSGTMNEHDSRKSLEVGEDSISAGLKTQMTRTPGNTAADKTNAVKTVSCIPSRVIPFRMSIGFFNSSTNVKVHTSATGGGASTRVEGCSDQTKLNSERVADCGVTACSPSSD